MQTYEQLLEKAKSQLKDVKIEKGRFEIPKAEGHVEGNKTIISNFAQMCSTFNRPQEQLLKYLQRELATPAEIDGPRLILGRKISSSIINQKIEQYAICFVLCKECKKPDTQLFKEDRILFMKCTACGARHPVKAKI